MKLSLKNITLLAFIFISFFIYKHNLYPQNTAGKAGATAIEDIRHINDLARFLSGMPISRKSILAPMVKYPSYKRHKAFMNRFWKQVKTDTIEKIVPWREKYLRGINKNRPVLYPLSGADLVNIHTFYPDAPVYVMIALEKAGNLPKLKGLNNKQLGIKLRSIQRFINSIALRNYLIYKTMDRETKRVPDMGITPVMLIFAARMNLRIKDFEQVWLSQNGQVITAGTDDRKNRKAGGIRISFSRRGKKDQKIVYLQLNLGARSYERNSALELYLRRLSRYNTLIKAGMYTLHQRRYRNLCKAIVNNSSTIIQDDTAMPYKYIRSSKSFKISLFGRYNRPAPLAGYPNPPRQPDLARDYSRNSTPLSFKFSYGVILGRNHSNLQLAVRKNITNKIISNRKLSPLNNKKTDIAINNKANLPKREETSLQVIKKNPDKKVDIRNSSKTDRTIEKEKKDTGGKRIIVDSFAVIDPGKNEDTAAFKSWSREFRKIEIMEWAKAQNLSIRDDLPPYQNRRAYFISPYGSRIDFKNLIRQKRYTLWIDFVTYKKYSKSSISSVLKIFTCDRNGNKIFLLKSINHSDIENSNSLYRLDIPYNHTILGETGLIFREYSPAKGFWGFWDMILSTNSNYPHTMKKGNTSLVK